MPSMVAAILVLSGGIGIIGSADRCLCRHPLAAMIDGAADTTSQDVSAFLADPGTSLGTRVTLTGCRLAGFISDAIGCYAEAGHGRVLVEVATFDRESLRQALRKCRDATMSTACRLSVSGIVGKDAQGVIRLRNAVVGSGN